MFGAEPTRPKQPELNYLTTQHNECIWVGRIAWLQVCALTCEPSRLGSNLDQTTYYHSGASLQAGRFINVCAVPPMEVKIVTSAGIIWWT